MEDQRRWGADPDEWAHFDIVLGLTADLLPVVANPQAEISPNSSIKSLGKLPSKYNKQKQAVGIADWTAHQATPQNIERWSQQPDYGICAICRTARGIDIDVDNPDLSAKIAHFIAQRLGVLPIRRRSNSGKLLLAFAMPGELGKRSVAVQGGMIEILGNNQQMLIAGTHTSGVRYEWAGGLPDNFPQISFEQFNKCWSEIVAAFGIAPASDGSLRNPRTEDVQLPADPVSSYLSHKNLILGEGREHQILIECPWKAGHSTDSGPTETAYFPVGSRGYSQGHFHCLHATCANRTDSEFLESLGYTANDFDQISNDETQHNPELYDLIPASVYALRPNPKWIIDGILPQASLAVLFGESGSGKSFLALDLALAIARGAAWQDKTTLPGRVVYICAEGAGGFAKRLKAYAQHNSTSLDGVPLQIIANQPNLLTKDDADKVAKSILTLGQADVIFIDTFAQVTPGGNENTAEDMGRALTHCARIHRATGALIVLIHHAGKDLLRGARGWSGIKAAADAEIEVLKVGASRKMRISKQKDGQEGEEFGFDLQPIELDMDGTNSCVIKITSVPVKPIETKPRGQWQNAVLQAWGECAEQRTSVSKIVEIITNKVPHINTSKRDRRRDQITRAIENLVIEGVFALDGLEVVPALHK